MTNLEQIRANYAFQIATQVHGETNNNYSDKFLSLARNLPTMFQNNGLLATWAFLLSKNKDEHKKISESICRFFKKPDFFCDVLPDNLDNKTIFTQYWTDTSSGFNSALLQQFTQEAIALSVWLKRAAEALCDTGGN